MAKRLQWLAPTPDAHLTDEQIIAAIDGDSPVSLPAHAVEHLDSCWKCLARKQQLKQTIVRVVDYQRDLLAPFLPPPPHGEDRFITRLDSGLNESAKGWGARLLLRLRPLGSPHMNPVFASIVVVLLAFTTLLLIWRRTGSAESASNLLERAEVWDRTPNNHEVGVVYQRIQIRAHEQVLERTLYRDVERRRTPKKSESSAEEEELRRTLARAGVPWDEPLSAVAFKDWHDGLTSKRDEVSRNGNDTMTLTTRAGDGPVAAESLVLRRADFHPVARSVQFRDAETIEVAELDYAVLGWNAMNDSLFEPLVSSASITPPVVQLPPLPTREALDEAELKARLALSRMNAESEQLEFTRSRKAIVVNGIVETDDRKNSLLTQLRSIPLVNPSIFSLEELNARRASPAASPVGSVRAYSDVSRSSPLEIFFRAQGETKRDVNAISQQVLDAALAVQQESSALTELSQRFPSNTHLGEQGRAILNELLERHSAKLAKDLDVEEQVVRSILPQDLLAASAAPPREDESWTLTAAAARNRALCSELISGAQAPSREAPAITADILGVIERARSLAADSRNTITGVAP
jgi:hypothetical protein